MNWPTATTEQQDLLKAYMLKQLNAEDMQAVNGLIASDEEVATQNDVFRLETVDSYLLGEMVGEDLNAFENALANDADLREEIEFNKMLNTTLGNPEIADMKKMLAGLKDAPAETLTSTGSPLKKVSETPLRAVKSTGIDQMAPSSKVVKLSFWKKNKSWLSIAAMFVLLALPLGFFLSGPSAGPSFADNFKDHQTEHFQQIRTRVNGNMGFAKTQIKKDVQAISKLMAEKQWQASSDASAAFTTKYPDQREALLLSTIAELHLSNGDAAMAHIKKYEQGNALQPEVVYYKAWAFWMQGKTEEAQTLFHSLAKGSSSYADDAKLMIQD